MRPVESGALEEQLVGGGEIAHLYGLSQLAGSTGRNEKISGEGWRVPSPSSRWEAPPLMHRKKWKIRVPVRSKKTAENELRFGDIRA